jgi:hypothetical protein
MELIYNVFKDCDGESRLDPNDTENRGAEKPVQSRVLPKLAPELHIERDVPK